MIITMDRMKTSRIFIIILVFLATVLLSACMGAGPANSSWPGVTVDSANQVAYVANGQYIYKVNLTSGVEISKFTDENNKKILFYANPALSGDGRVLAGGYDTNLYSIDAETNEQVWLFDQAEKRYIAGPLVSEQGIFAPNEDNSLYALDKDGKLLWQYLTDNTLWATPTTDGKNIYLASMDHMVYAIDALSGKLVWKTDDLGGTLTGGPTLGPDGRLYVGTFGSEMLALNAQDGREIWRTKTVGWVWSAPALVEGTVYFGDLNSTIYALSAENGKVLWQVQPDTSDKRVITGTPLVLDGVVYVGTESGNFYALNATDGSQLRQPMVFEGKIYTSPQAAGDLILVALTKDGAQKWQFPPPPPPK
jgi:outer membrane protein assembly factor BamB